MLLIFTLQRTIQTYKWEMTEQSTGEEALYHIPSQWHSKNQNNGINFLHLLTERNIHKTC